MKSVTMLQILCYYKAAQTKITTCLNKKFRMVFHKSYRANEQKSSSVDQEVNT